MSTLLVAGCAVGPNFHTPAPPAVTSLTPSPLRLGLSSAEQQAYVRTLNIPQQWWEVFHCQALNTIIKRAFDDNADLEAASANVRIARADELAARGGLFPQVGSNLQSSYQKPADPQQLAASAVAKPYAIQTAQLTVSYLPDIFGLNARQVESKAAVTEVQKFQLAATFLALAAKIASAAIAEASLRDQLDSARISIATAHEILDLLNQQLSVQEVSRIDVSAQQVALAQFEQNFATIQKRLALNRDLLIALTGHLAGEGLTAKFNFSCLHLPAELPVTLPTTIVRNRPDIRAAEAMMHSATAEIGVAIANRLPQFNLTANPSTSASTIAQLASFSSPLLFWSIAGSVSQTLFDGMSAEQRQRGAEAGLDRAAAMYRSTIILAFQNVADVLQAIELDRKLFLSADRGAKAARTTLDMTKTMLKAGEANSLQLLNAEQTFAQSRSNLAQAREARLNDAVLLFQALGGGWQAPEPSPISKTWSATVKVNSTAMETELSQ